MPFHGSNRGSNPLGDATTGELEIETIGQQLCVLPGDVEALCRYAEQVAARQVAHGSNLVLTLLSRLTRVDPNNERFVAAYTRYLERFESRDTIRQSLRAQEAAKPGSTAQSWYELAVREFDSGNTHQSLIDLQVALTIAPDRASSWHTKALIIRDGDNSIQARTFLMRACNLDSPNIVYKADLLLALASAKDERAIKDLERLAKATSNATALLNLALSALNLGEFIRAKEATRKLISVLPHSQVSYSKHAITSLSKSDTLDAEASISRALIIRPGWLEARINLARLRELEGNTQLALELYESVIAERPDLPEPMFNASACALSLGDFEKGWSWYGARWNVKSMVSSVRDKRPVMFRSVKPTYKLGNRTPLLIWAEQGLGDEIMFSSVFNDVLGKVSVVLIQCDPRLISLLGRSFPSATIISKLEGVSEDAYDQQISMGDLAGMLRPSRRSFPRVRLPYLRADSANVSTHRHRLKSQSCRLLIGVSWRSSNPDTGPDRTIPIDLLIRTLSTEGVDLVNLQYDWSTEDELRMPGGSSNPSLLSPQIDNWNDIDGLASVISACDLVIAVGNTVAHLSGALGKETWVLVPAAGSWRWMHSGYTTPWYPTVRVFRQARRQRGNWSPVLSDVRATLLRRLQSDT